MLHKVKAAFHTSPEPKNKQLIFENLPRRSKSLKDFQKELNLIQLIQELDKQEDNNKTQNGLKKHKLSILKQLELKKLIPGFLNKVKSISEGVFPMLSIASKVLEEIHELNVSIKKRYNHLSQILLAISKNYRDLESIQLLKKPRKPIKKFRLVMEEAAGSGAGGSQTSPSVNSNCAKSLSPIYFDPNKRAEAPKGHRSPQVGSGYPLLHIKPKISQIFQLTSQAILSWSDLIIGSSSQAKTFITSSFDNFKESSKLNFEGLSDWMKKVENLNVAIQKIQRSDGDSAELERLIKIKQDQIHQLNEEYFKDVFKNCKDSQEHILKALINFSAYHIAIFEQVFSF